MKESSQKKKVTKRGIPLSQALLHLESPGEVALYYGFSALDVPHITKEDLSKVKAVSQGEMVIDNDTHESGAVARLEEKIALIRTYFEKKLSEEPQPVMLYYKGPFIGGQKKSGQREYQCGLEIIGTDKSIAEAILIATSLAILKEETKKELFIDINSIGDKESANNFMREMTSFYRKNLHELPASCRQTFKKDVFSLLGCMHEKCKSLSEECPKSINFLSEKSRAHFKEVLEYLEELSVPYKINNALVANRDYCSETVFEVREENVKDGHPLAVGIRYDTLAKKIGTKKDVYAVGVSIAFKKTHTFTTIKRSQVEKLIAPEVYLIQFGFEAKLKSLEIVELLRQEKIAVYQSLSKDKLAGQVAIAEKMKIPYVIIVGMKEAMENSAIVRHVVTRSQDTVSIPDLPLYIKKIKNGPKA